MNNGSYALISLSKYKLNRIFFCVMPNKKAIPLLSRMAFVCKSY